MKGLPNTCHNFRTEGFHIPIKPFLIENLDLFGNPVVTLVVLFLSKQQLNPYIRYIFFLRFNDLN